MPEVDRLSSGFLTLASHELRTPLTVTKGNLQLAQRRVERLKRELAQQVERTSADLEQIQRSLEAAAQSVRLQERMVRDTIDLMLAPCDQLVLVKQAIAKQQEAVPERAITLEILTPESTIPLEEQVRLWDRFYRGKGSSVQQELDLSLGLRFYLCRALLERHHGTVGVESTPGQGTTFWLTLPIARPARASRESLPSPG